VEALREQLSGGSRTVCAMDGERLVALAEMRAGSLNPVRVFQLT
jgi:tRNA pseudouridine55 synthase